MVIFFPAGKTVVFAVFAEDKKKKNENERSCTTFLFCCCFAFVCKAVFVIKRLRWLYGRNYMERLLIRKSCNVGSHTNLFVS